MPDSLSRGASTGLQSPVDLTREEEEEAAAEEEAAEEEAAAEEELDHFGTGENMCAFPVKNREWTTTTPINAFASVASEGCEDRPRTQAQ